MLARCVHHNGNPFHSPSLMEPELSFHGGAGTVTGSRYLVRTGKREILIDAGLFQGLKKLRRLNWKKPTFDVPSVDRLLLTHAHIDHSGYLPRLVREGYSRPIHCTPATLDLAKLLLMDAAKIQEEDAEYACFLPGLFRLELGLELQAGSNRQQPSG